MAFQRRMFEEYGEFRTDLGKSGADTINGEDTEFCVRLLRDRRKIVYEPSALVYHPVPATNLKRHFQAHYFSCGRYAIRVEGIPSQAVLWFGVPRYMFRTLLTDVWAWAFCVGPERFRHKLQACESLGAIFEAHRVSREMGLLREPRPTLDAGE